MEEPESQVLLSILEALSEIKALLKISAGPAAMNILENALQSDTERKAYDLTDGEKTQSQIAQAVGVTQATVSNWWKRWIQFGILANSNTGRPRKLFDLSSAKIYSRQNLNNENDQM
jgi:hypothetical protein